MLLLYTHVYVLVGVGVDGSQCMWLANYGNMLEECVSVRLRRPRATGNEVDLLLLWEVVMCVTHVKEGCWSTVCCLVGLLIVVTLVFLRNNFRLVGRERQATVLQCHARSRHANRSWLLERSGPSRAHPRCSAVCLFTAAVSRQDATNSGKNL